MIDPNHIQRVVDWFEAEIARFEAVESIIGVRFVDRTNLRIALEAYRVGRHLHKNRPPKRGLTDNRRKFHRLALLGDGVIQLSLTDLFEGSSSPQIWRQRTELLSSNKHLSDVLDRLGLTDYLDRTPHSISDLPGTTTRASNYEAVVGAIFLDRGLWEARSFLDRTLIREASEES